MLPTRKSCRTSRLAVSRNSEELFHIEMGRPEYQDSYHSHLTLSLLPGEFSAMQILSLPSHELET